MNDRFTDMGFSQGHQPGGGGGGGGVEPDIPSWKIAKPWAREGAFVF